MKIEQYKRAQELIKLIDNARTGLSELEALKKAAKEHPAVADEAYTAKADNIYNLSIAQYKDGSGYNAVLSRYEGNDELLDVIIQTLEKQLASFVAEFESM